MLPAWQLKLKLNRAWMVFEQNKQMLALVLTHNQNLRILRNTSNNCTILSVTGSVYFPTVIQSSFAEPRKRRRKWSKKKARTEASLNLTRPVKIPWVFVQGCIWNVVRDLDPNRTEKVGNCNPLNPLFRLWSPAECCKLYFPSDLPWRCRHNPLQIAKPRDEKGFLVQYGPQRFQTELSGLSNFISTPVCWQKSRSPCQSSPFVRWSGGRGPTSSSTFWSFGIGSSLHTFLALYSPRSWPPFNCWWSFCFGGRPTGNGPRLASTKWVGSPKKLGVIRFCFWPWREKDCRWRGDQISWGHPKPFGAGFLGQWWLR